LADGKDGVRLHVYLTLGVFISVKWFGNIYKLAVNLILGCNVKIVMCALSWLV